jgi:hypothetical protein
VTSVVRRTTAAKACISLGNHSFASPVRRTSRCACFLAT